MTSLKTVQFSRPPTPLVQLRPKFFHPLDLGPHISNEPPYPPTPPSPNDNQSIERKHNPSFICYTLSGLSFRSSFVFSINSLSLSCFPLISFHLAEASLLLRAISKN